MNVLLLFKLLLAGRGGASFNYFIVGPVVPNLGVRPPPKGHKINLRGSEMIHWIGKNMENKSSATQNIH